MLEVFEPNRLLQLLRVFSLDVLFCLLETISWGLQLVLYHHILGMLLIDCNTHNRCIFASIGEPFHSLSASADPPAASTTSIHALVAFFQASSAVLKSGALRSIRYDGAPS
mgnify:CR=1 FL=1